MIYESFIYELQSGLKCDKASQHPDLKGESTPRQSRSLLEIKTLDSTIYHWLWSVLHKSQLQ